MRLLAIFLEVTGIVLTSIGIGIEVIMRADFGFIFLTVGALLLSIGGLVYAKTDWANRH